jgi:hypothetical protein
MCILNIRFHLQFGKYINDIALIRLSKPVEWNDLAQPICLPDPEVENFAGKHGLLAGWGFDKEGELRVSEGHRVR